MKLQKEQKMNSNMLQVQISHLSVICYIISLISSDAFLKAYLCLIFYNYYKHLKRMAFRACALVFWRIEILRAELPVSKRECFSAGERVSQHLCVCNKRVVHPPM